MAQLIKLYDYISRYEVNMFQYPARYIRLKSEQWQDRHERFENKGPADNRNPAKSEDIREDKSLTWKRFLPFKKSGEESGKAAPPLREGHPKTLKELKQEYLDQLFPFQLKWATTTIQKKSFLNPAYKSDPLLTYYLQRFPDTYLLMYQPVANMKKTQVEMDNILISPHGLDIVTYINAEPGEIVYPGPGHTWMIEKDGHQRKILNPLISLKRTETFVRSVLDKYTINFPYQKVILAPELNFDNTQKPYSTIYVGKELYSGWLYEKRKEPSPLKHNQLKTADALLRHCWTSAVRRAEWDTEQQLKEE
ncbi:NERD domain-containing protein [Halobacillus litoralis]|uniref:NERD domain-containing protein n=1 Tax=Halobacillus litoralis TaxID=45668 RepID=UPI001CFE471F|nr:NERD domain-containing protein [Halobacillus litoralis]